MTFNPEDFVFKKIRVPEDNPTILEYDALQKFIVVKAQDQYDDEEYQSAILSDQVNTNLLENLPDKFSNRNDRIILFYIRKDGKYRLEREKLKYDFSTRESKWVRYTHKGLTLEEAKELFDAIKAAVWTQELVDQEKLERDTLQIAKKEIYTNKLSLQKETEKERLLRSSDWRVLPDTPEEFDGEKDLWVIWRQQLRDLVKVPSDFDDPLDFLVYMADFRWPYNPLQYHHIDPEHTEEYLSNRELHWTSSFNDSINSHNLNEINDRIAKFAKNAREQEGAVPVDRKLMNLINRYNLLDNIDDIQVVASEDFNQ